MKKICSFAVLLFSIVAGSAFAQTNSQAGVANTSTCVPYTIPNAASVVACGNGQVGSKFTTTKKICPSGQIVVSTEYDTSGCKAAPPPQNAVNTVNRCQVTPDACASIPNPSGCATGKHWTLEGSNEAHCVLDDYTCPWGSSLTHDYLGNPSCVANTCPSNQQLQGDGVSCACPSSMPVWDGSSCTAQAVTCTPNSYDSNPVSCGSGYTGTKTRTVTVSCPDGSYGSPSTSYSAYDTSDCVANAVTCQAGSVQNPDVACGGGQSGTKFTTTTTSCPNGSYGAPTTTTSGYDTSGCSASATCSPGTVANSSVACGANFTGTKFTTTTTSCPAGSSGAPSMTTSGYDTSGCGCANGGTNYPTCTAPATCTPNTYANAQVDCGVGFTGKKFTTTTVSCPGSVTTTSAYDMSGCSAICTPKTTNNSAPCDSGFTGNKTSTTTVTCPGSVSTTTTWDTSACTPVCTVATVDNAPVACGSGFTGTKYTSTTTHADCSTTTSGFTTSGCGCSNGGSDYPTCTAPNQKPCNPGVQDNAPVACGPGYTGTRYTTTTKTCPGPVVSTSDYHTDLCGCSNGGTDYPTCTPPSAPACDLTNGHNLLIGSTCVDCDSVGWSNIFSANNTSTKRACYFRYGDGSAQ